MLSQFLRRKGPLMTFPDPIEPPENNPNPADPIAQSYERFRKRRGGYRNHYTFEKFLAFIESKGEATPGDLAKEFGWARSSLSYTFNRLIKEGKIVRLGGGRSIRYRVTTQEEKDAHWKAKWAKKSANSSAPSVNTTPPAAAPAEPPPVDKPPEQGILHKGWRSWIRKVLNE